MNVRAGDGSEDDGPAGSAAKWNARYAFSGDTVPPPAEVLSREAHRLPPASGAGEALGALDLACGRAGNGEWLAARGFAVSAWDVSERAIEAIRARPASGIRTAAVRDVLVRPPEPDSFDVIVVARFLERGICPAIARALRPGGMLYYQTFTAGLANPDYLLGPNELLALFPSLAICSYREPRAVADGEHVAVGIERVDAGAVDVARVGAVRTEAMLVARRTP